MGRALLSGENARPVWTPDGKRVTFPSTRDGRRALYWAPADGSAEAELLLATEYEIWEAAWVPDGRTLVFRQNSTGRGGRDIWYMSLDGDRTPKPLLTAVSSSIGAATG